MLWQNDITEAGARALIEGAQASKVPRLAPRASRLAQICGPSQEAQIIPTYWSRREPSDTSDAAPHTRSLSQSVERLDLDKNHNVAAGALSLWRI